MSVNSSEKVRVDKAMESDVADPQHRFRRVTAGPVWSTVLGPSLKSHSIVWICALLFIVMAVSSDVFVSQGNISNLLGQWATVGIIAAAGTFVLISRMFDLSVGAAFAFSGVITATVAANTGNVWAAFLAGILAGGLIGVVNGITVAVLNINPFIATLATSMLATGAAIIVSGGQLITVADPAFSQLGRGRILGLSIPAIVFIVVLVVGGFVLSRTTFGRYIYAVGDNPEAARLSGVRVGWVHMSVFIISGLAAGIAGVLAASRVSSGQADAAGTIPLVVIACVVVGGTSIFGGEGAMWRTALGVLLYAMVGNGFTLLGIDSNIQQMVQGSILLVAVGIDAWSRRKS
jgi:ribose transport system permease protein